MPLELVNLRNTIARLDEAMRLSEDPELHRALETVMRAGVIKNFEFTYELSWQYIKRWLDIDDSPNTADGVTRRELFRFGFEPRLIQERRPPPRWTRPRGHRTTRLTSSGRRPPTPYIDAISRFLDDARHVLAALEARND